jgi:hypothetical protein
MDLTKSFDKNDYDEALTSWQWLDLAGKRPLFTSLFGDVFLEANDGCWLLDVVSGKYGRTWPSVSEMESDLASEQGRVHYLLEPLVRAAVDHGLRLGPEQVFDFTRPPVLGGERQPDNLGVVDFVVAVNLAGQIHAQVRNLPPGTPIGEITIVQP